MPEWQAFFTAQLGASAALVGLLFVGVSLNLSKILGSSGLPDRALAGFYLLLANVILSSLMLLPDQLPNAPALEILAVGILLWALVTRLAVTSLRQSPQATRHYFVRHFLFIQVSAIPYLVGGVLLLEGVARGMYWVAAAIIVSLSAATYEAWVLLVEINR
jgi:modulator of FtsH protease